MNNTTSLLEAKIIKKINDSANERITFYEFMEMALYEKNLGYYTKERLKIGKDADFYTSSSVGAVFGKSIANNFLELLPYTTDKDLYNIVEIGGGNGRFARDVLDEIKSKEPDTYNKLVYYMSETSPYHQKLQSEILLEHLEHIKWIEDLEELTQPFEGIFFSNELLDAFPVHKVIQKADRLQEIYVTYDDKSHEFKEINGELSIIDLKKYFEEQEITLSNNQIAEVNLGAISWINSIDKALKKGYIVTIDYGYEAEELYASNRMEGTLMCYYKHTTNDDPYKNIGDQDITSHVNFSVPMNYGEKRDIKNILFTTQSKFLLNNGILNYLIDNPQTDQEIKVNRAIRQLIIPEAMGETFKILLQQKNIAEQRYKFLDDLWKRDRR